MKKILGLSLYGSIAASNRYRLGLYKKFLHENGIELEIYGLFEDDYLAARFSKTGLPIRIVFKSIARRIIFLKTKIRLYDGCIIHAELIPLFPFGFENLLLKNIPFIYDFDDAFFLKYDSERYRFFRWFLKNKFKAIIKKSIAVTAGNLYLQSFAKKYNYNSYLLPTVVDMTRYGVAEKIKKDISEEKIIGWIGSPSTTGYLKLIERPLQKLAKIINFKLRIVGGIAIEIKGVNYEIIPWTEETEVKLIQSFDVGVMPLPDDPWSRGKCAFKLIQCMACGIPVVGSRVGANVDLLVDKFPDFLASTDDEWIYALYKILSNDVEGSAIREHIQDNYSINKTAPIMLDIINNHLQIN